MTIKLMPKCMGNALLLLLLLGVYTTAYAAGGGSITLSGTEQVNSSTGLWDAGTVTVAVNGYAKSFSYGQYSTPDSIASAIAAMFSSDCYGPANAKSAPGGVINFKMRNGGVLSTLTVNTYSSISFAGVVNSTNLIPTTTSATIAATQVVSGQSTTVDVQVSCNSACGTVDYRIDGGEWGVVALDVNGHFSTTTNTGLAPGLHSVIINYQGNGSYEVSSSNPVSFYVSSTSNTATVYSYNISSYQPNNNISAYSDSVSGIWNNLQYDGMSRLTAATQNNNGSQSMCWSYDSFGNRSPQTTISPACYSSPPPSPAAQYNTNNQNTALAYDASGDLTNDGTNQYLYDAEGRICAVQHPVIPGGPSAMEGYIYDADGKRVAKGMINTWSCDTNTNNFSETNGYIAESGGEMMTEVDGGGNWHTDVRANGELIATYDPSGLHFHLSDWLGTRRVDTDFLGNPGASYQNLPFGELSPPSQIISGTDDFFTGKKRDAESGLDYFGARYYSSNMGRFMTPDPGWFSASDIRDPQSLNQYSYVENNPLRFVDPDGMHFECTTSTITYEDEDGNYQSDSHTSCKWIDDPVNPVSDLGSGFNVINMAPSKVQPFSASAGLAPNSGHNKGLISDSQYRCESAVIGAALVRGVADALGAQLDPPGSDPSKDVSDAVKNAASNRVVQMSVGVMATKLAQSLLTRAGALELGAFVGEKLVPFVGEGAAAYSGYKVATGTSDYYRQNIGACKSF